MAKNKVEINGINTSSLNVLTHDEMVNLFIDYSNGVMSAKEKLIKGNLKLVLSILRKYQNKCDNLDDLFQVGVVGLIKAIDNFDVSIGVRFSTYAVFMIDGEIKRYIRDNSSLRISRSVKELSYSIINYREEYLNTNGVYPSNEEVCSYFNISEYELYNSLNSLNKPVSIFEPIYNDGGETLFLLDQLEDTSSRDLDSLILLRDAILKLKDRERSVLLKRYVEGLSQSEIASVLNISQAQVSRIESSALNNVRKHIL
ncbi:MAG: sigma-70 family RNA polymerase sigma factor [Bacilli bacterium]|nr:sigma-70 family RNA polymerase sigma factor [Bacilli bacterium]